MPRRSFKDAKAGSTFSKIRILSRHVMNRAPGRPERDMLETTPAPPERNIVFFRAVGTLTEADYAEVFSPAMGAVLAEHSQFRLYCDLSRLLDWDESSRWETGAILASNAHPLRTGGHRRRSVLGRPCPHAARRPSARPLRVLHQRSSGRSPHLDSHTRLIFLHSCLIHPRVDRACPPCTRCSMSFFHAR